MELTEHEKTMICNALLKQKAAYYDELSYISSDFLRGMIAELTALHDKIERGE